MNKDQAKELTEQSLNELIAALNAGKSERLVQYLRCLSHFTRYSIRNLLLISAQRPTATRVAGFHTWRKLNRMIRKGEKGIAILAPLASRKKTDEVPDSDDKNSVVGFRVVHVFDIEQTDGDVLPSLTTASGDPGQALANLETVIQRNGIALYYEELSAGLEGYSAGGKIVINEQLQDARRFSVLAHELAHEWLDHATTQQTKKVRETEAEAVAFVVCTAYGIESQQSTTEYIQLYQGDGETLCSSLKVIQQVAVRILNEMAAGS